MKASRFLAERREELGLDDASFRAHLRARLRERGVEISRQNAYQWVNGDSCPAPEVLPIVCEVLGLDAHGAADFYQACGIPLPDTLRPAQGAA